MEFNKRVKDVSQIVDSQFSVNHSYLEKQKFLDSRKNHFKRMYNIKDKEEKRKEILHASSIDGRLDRLNQKINAMNASEKLIRRNNFK